MKVFLRRSHGQSIKPSYWPRVITLTLETIYTEPQDSFTTRDPVLTHDLGRPYTRNPQIISFPELIPVSQLNRIDRILGTTCNRDSPSIHLTLKFLQIIMADTCFSKTYLRNCILFQFQAKNNAITKNIFDIYGDVLKVRKCQRW
jgi:hypothetical protein